MRLFFCSDKYYFYFNLLFIYGIFYYENYFVFFDCCIFLLFNVLYIYLFGIGF